MLFVVYADVDGIVSPVRHWHGWMDHNWLWAVHQSCFQPQVI